MPWACFGVRGGYCCLDPDGRFCLCFAAATEKVVFLTPPESDQSRSSSLWVPYVTLLRGFGGFSGRIGLEKEVSASLSLNYREEKSRFPIFSEMASFVFGFGARYLPGHLSGIQ